MSADVAGGDAQLQPECYWTMININAIANGDAHLIGDRITSKAVLIDTGSAAAAELILLPYLRAHRITELAAVLITHPHDDHYGGLLALLDSSIRIGRIYMSTAPSAWLERERHAHAIEELAAIICRAAEHDIPVME
ncbi:MAG: MBL fold metallo-hydrolase, partial [Lentisphaerae bacterium]|nr:MBL fold metallo-hydrolase [Lentisphaerota bacterium]